MDLSIVTTLYLSAAYLPEFHRRITALATASFALVFRNRDGYSPPKISWQNTAGALAALTKGGDSVDGFRAEREGRARETGKRGGGCGRTH
jgi:hypothetical protein